MGKAKNSSNKNDDKKETKTVRETKATKKKENATSKVTVVDINAEDLPEIKESKRSKRVTNPVDYNINNIIEENIGSTSINAKTFQPMLAETYDGSQEIINWLMSEKLDGVRCIWTGKSLYSRNGNIFHPPDFFKKDFPTDMILDGELFMERNEFSKTISIVKKQYKHDGWEKIKYIVFDAPKVKGTLKQRLDIAEERIKKINSPYIAFHKQEVLVSIEELNKKMDEVIALKGEGVIVRDPESLYENKRSSSMLKVKKFHDAEATVIGHQKGEGRCIGMLGALIVRNDDGIEFKVGSGFDDSQRRNPPKIGSRITYKYFEISKDSKKPRFPTFLRVHPGL